MARWVGSATSILGSLRGAGRPPLAGFVAVVLLAVAVALGSVFRADVPGLPGHAVAGAERRLNVMVVLADDLAAGDLRQMPRTRRLFTDRGLSFANATVTYSLCCPSRVTLLTGRYAHNHGIWTNGPYGSLAGRQASRRVETTTLPVWLQQAGYHTAHVGKYPGIHPKLEVPPGWDRFLDRFESRRADGTAVPATMAEDGRLVDHGADTYLDDVIFDHAGRLAVQAPEPWFLHVAPIAPHVGLTSVPNLDAYDDATVPDTPSHDEKDVADKPRWVRDLPRFTPRGRDHMNGVHRYRLATVAALDRQMADLVAVLDRSGRLDRTVVLFTSDNGYHLGQHRLHQGKETPYVEDVRVPLLVLGPGVAAGGVRRQLVSNTDLAPTIADLASVPVPLQVDGQSLVGLFDAEPQRWTRRQLLVERFDMPAGTYAMPDYDALLSGRWSYVEYADGDRELYDLARDPHQLTSLHERRPDLVRRLAADLGALKNCVGVSCRAIEDGTATPQRGAEAGRVSVG